MILANLGSPFACDNRRIFPRPRRQSNCRVGGSEHADKPRVPFFSGLSENVRLKNKDHWHWNEDIHNARLLEKGDFGFQEAVVENQFKSTSVAIGETPRTDGGFGSLG